MTLLKYFYTGTKKKIYFIFKKIWFRFVFEIFGYLALAFPRKVLNFFIIQFPFRFLQWPMGAKAKVG